MKVKVKLNCKPSLRNPTDALLITALFWHFDLLREGDEAI